MSNSSTSTSRKGKRLFIPNRDAVIKQIRRAIIEGKSNIEIMKDFNLSRRSFFRYRSEAFADKTDEYKHLQERDDLLEDMAVLEERLSQTRNEINELSDNNEIESKERDSRVAAKMTAYELAVKLFNLHSKIAVYGVEKEVALEQQHKREERKKRMMRAEEEQRRLELEEEDDLDDDDDEEGNEDLLGEDGRATTTLQQQLCSMQMRPKQ